MAHRTQYSQDIYLPKYVQQQRQYLQKQIQKVRQRQRFVIEENDKKLLGLQKRLIYGKKKIFSNNDKQFNRMTLNDQISHYNMDIQKLKDQIAKQQKAIKSKNQEGKNKQQNYFVNQTVLQAAGMHRQSPSSRIKQPHLIADPQQELMSLTHEIIRLKKSLQEVRSKYSDNFTEYKLKQQYQKLKQQNQQIAHEFKQLQVNKNQLSQAVTSVNLPDVDYDQMQIMKAQMEFELVRKQRGILKEYLDKLQGQIEQRKQTDERKVQVFKEETIEKLTREIDMVTKHNKILENEIHLADKQIQRRLKYQQQLRIPSN